MRLPRSFYTQPTRQLASALLGCRLVRRWQGQRLSGLIVETEAYLGETDLACHAHVGRTARNAVMYGKPGLAYVYFTYGMHWLLNVVSEAEDFPAAVLIRALEPQERIDVMQQHRPVPRPIELCRGPRVGLFSTPEPWKSKPWRYWIKHSQFVSK